MYGVGSWKHASDAKRGADGRPLARPLARPPRAPARPSRTHPSASIPPQVRVLRLRMEDTAEYPVRSDAQAREAPHPHSSIRSPRTAPLLLLDAESQALLHCSNSRRSACPPHKPLMPRPQLVAAANFLERAFRRYKRAVPPLPTPPAIEDEGRGRKGRRCHPSAPQASGASA